MRNAFRFARASEAQHKGGFDRFKRKRLTAQATPTDQNRAEISQLQQPGHQIRQDEMTVIHVKLLIRDCTKAPIQ
jgi:hypothetical protein